MVFLASSVRSLLLSYPWSLFFCLLVVLLVLPTCAVFALEGGCRTSRPGSCMHRARTILVTHCFRTAVIRIMKRAIAAVIVTAHDVSSARACKGSVLFVALCLGCCPFVLASPWSVFALDSKCKHECYNDDINIDQTTTSSKQDNAITIAKPFTITRLSQENDCRKIRIAQANQDKEWAG